MTNLPVALQALEAEMRDKADEFGAVSPEARWWSAQIIRWADRLAALRAEGEPQPIAWRYRRTDWTDLPVDRMWNYVHPPNTVPDELRENPLIETQLVYGHPVAAPPAGDATRQARADRILRRHGWEWDAEVGEYLTQGETAGDAELVRELRWAADTMRGFARFPEEGEPSAATCNGVMVLLERAATRLSPGGTRRDERGGGGVVEAGTGAHLEPPDGVLANAWFEWSGELLRPPIVSDEWQRFMRASIVVWRAANARDQL